MNVPCLVRLKTYILAWPGNGHKSIVVKFDEVILVLSVHDRRRDPDNWNPKGKRPVHWILYKDQKCTTDDLDDETYEIL